MPPLDPEAPIFGGRTSTRVLRLQNVTMVEARVAGSSLHISGRLLRMSPTHLVEIMSDFLHHLQLELALPAYQRLYQEVNRDDLHLPHHELLVETLLSCQDEQSGAFRREESGAQPGVPFFPCQLGSPT
jgi:hypothetical protein